jgi:acyl-CoA dehydrogenase
MDFDLTQDQQALRDLARRILTDHVTDDRLKSLKAAGEWWDGQTWDALAGASLLGVAVPEEHGGSGLGLLELGLLCQ